MTPPRRRIPDQWPYATREKRHAVNDSAPKIMPEPRGMRHEQAAHYVGMKLSKFYEMVKDGRMAKPKRVDGCTVWDRFSLEMAFENLPDENETNPWDEDGS